MNKFKSSVLCATAAMALQLSACATTPAPDQAEIQLQAMQRWSNCLERNTTPGATKVADYNRIVEGICEGHKRDVVDSFPRHLESQVTQLLADDAFRYLNANGPTQPTPTSSAFVQTLLR